MKVITGKYRGRFLETPEGLNTRPTTGKIKESIFNIIQFDIEGRRVLDLFAGSGQMGLEALSRGAESCVFCDTDRKALSVIGRNIEKCKAQNEAKVYNRDGLSFLKSAGKNSFGLIFLDPPYAAGLMDEAINIITNVDILQDGGIILCESGRDWNAPELTAPYRVVKVYEYGTTKITTITKGE
ncbi:MAG: 16S rRNA (guanine(966)-N(2))-methyltransferase RsmD [Clostridia bacterium]|nr:16S rRNA (guanine(966)-N(2))-methyltransferase RsmD [Clostridia bacterium]